MSFSEQDLVSARRTPRPREPQKQSHKTHKNARASIEARARQIPQAHVRRRAQHQRAQVEHIEHELEQRE